MAVRALWKHLPAFGVPFGPVRLKPVRALWPSQSARSRSAATACEEVTFGYF